MTNDQKFFAFMNDTQALLDNLDKAERAGSATMYAGEVKKQRRDLKILIAQNRMGFATKPVKKKSPNTYNHNQNWLAQ